MSFTEQARPSTALVDLAARIDDALPQTQCTRCGYPDCASYARAIATGVAGINQCPPGGVEGVERLSAITGRPVLPLSPEHGIESSRAVALIDETWCIGCTLCIQACPTDAIVGSHKMMHTVMEPYCTGCELCIPVCPVDCIQLDNVSGAATGWSAWSAPLAQQARRRYQSHQARLPLDDADDVRGDVNPVLSDATSAQDAAATRQAAIAAAMERARKRRLQGSGG